MLNEVWSIEGLRWIDIVGPTREELEKIALEFNFPLATISDCLEPEHLPKHEGFEGKTFFILRAFDDSSAASADTIQELTFKIAVFTSDTELITVHRRDHEFFLHLRDNWKHKKIRKGTKTTLIVEELQNYLIGGTLTTFDKPVDQALNALEKLEMEVFRANGARKFEIRNGYFLKRRAFVIKRLMHMTHEILPRLSKNLDLRDHTKDTLYYADELLESVNALLNLHLALASQRTNNVVRILTIFSMFLLPLNVITGIYGMNFRYMPELQWQWGYPLTLGAMVILIICVFIFFKKRGWFDS